MRRGLTLTARLTTALLAIAAGLSACERQAPTRPEGPLRIVVSVPPLASIVERLAPEDGQITVWTPAGASPHAYEPTPERVRAIVQADVVVLVGAGLDRAAGRLLEARPRPWRHVVTLASFADGAADHDHGHGHAHGGGPELDPHLWLDIDVLARAAPAISHAIESSLGQVEPTATAAADRLNRAEQALLEEIAAVRAEYEAALAPASGTGMVALHGGVAPLVTPYGLEVVVSIDGHHIEPSPAQVAQASGALREGRASIVVRAPSSPPGLATRLADRAGAPVVMLDPVGSRDWFALMRANLAALVEGLRDAGVLASPAGAKGTQPAPSSPG